MEKKTKEILKNAWCIRIEITVKVLVLATVSCFDDGYGKAADGLRTFLVFRSPGFFLFRFQIRG